MSYDNGYPKVMLVEEVAEYLRVNKQTVYNLVKQGKLPACKVGGQWRFDRNTLDEFLRSPGNINIAQVSLSQGPRT